MTNEQINKYIATRVMGYTRKGSSNDAILYYDGDVWTSYTDRKYRIGKVYTPTTDVGQAIEALEKWVNIGGRASSHKYSCVDKLHRLRLWTGGWNVIAEAKHQSLARAICEALIQATEGK